MIGKNFRRFSSDWKTFSWAGWGNKKDKKRSKRRGGRACQTIMTISDNCLEKTTWATRDNFSRGRADNAGRRKSEICLPELNWQLKKGLRPWTLTRPEPQTTCLLSLDFVYSDMVLTRRKPRWSYAPFRMPLSLWDDVQSLALWYLFPPRITLHIPEDEPCGSVTAPEG